jgi:GT2 family glycosyltransferase
VFEQSCLPDQLIIVDQSHDDSSVKAVGSEIAAQSEAVRQRVELRYLQDPSIMGLPTARNRAMEMAQGDVWLFLDDDVWLERDFLAQMLNVYRTCPNVGGCSGIITNYPTPPLLYRLWSALFVRGPFHDERQLVYWKADSLRNSEPIVVRKLSGGLMSFRPDVVRDIRFDDKLRGVSDGEDVDFCVRLNPDTVLVIAPRARLEHKASPAGRLRDHWLRRSARSNFFLYEKNWKTGLANRVCILWLTLGYSLVATIASLRRMSLQPWRSFLVGVREGKVAVY